MNKRILMALAGIGLGMLVAGVLGVYVIFNYFPQAIPDSVARLGHEPDLVKQPRAQRCGECHGDIFEAWKKSRHSLSWVSKFYIKDSDHRKKEKCLPCHIPAQVSPGEKPQPRDWARNDGVYCVPCHVVDGVMNGPYKLFAPPHPTRQNMKFRKSMFCGSCHQKTFKEWQAADVGESCQSCHMGPAHEKRLTQVPFLSRLHAKRRVRNHSFPHNEINDENLLVKAKVEEGNLQVALLNGGVPHLLPTADNGDPRLYLYVRYLSEAGEEVDEYKEILAPQQDTALVYGKPTEFKYPVPKAVKRIEIEVQYRPAWSKDKQTVRTVELTQIFND